jgi:threonine dehydratase
VRSLNNPGFVAVQHLNSILARFNVVSQSLRTTPLIGYIIIDVEGAGATELKDEVFSLETSFRTRLLD